MVRQGRRGRWGDDSSSGRNDERTALAMAALGSAKMSGTTERAIAGGDETVATTMRTTMVWGAGTVNTTAVVMPCRI